MKFFNFGKEKDEKLEDKIVKLNKEIEQKKIELASLKKEIDIMNNDIELQSFGFFKRQYKFSDSTQYKNELDKIRNLQKEMVKNNTAGVIVRPMLLDNSQSKGAAMQKQLIKAAIRGFNGEAESLLVKITVSNIESKKTALKRSFEQLNKMYARNLIQISDKYLKLKLKELDLAAEYEYKKQEEKDLLREQREQEKEDKKLQSELKEKRKKLNKDKTHFKQMIENVEELLKNTTLIDEIEKLKLQLLEYENKLAEIDELENELDYRESNATAGYVYVISNIGAFGEDVYKIGVTRRLDPLDRIRELGNASVPFHFDVHALVFSENAFSLESELHKTFEKFKVNKVNSRKEYFKVPFEQIKHVLEKHKELTLELNEKAEAFEYRQSNNVPL